MRRHQLVREEDVKNCFWGHKKSSITGGATITFCAQTAHITNICMKSGLIIFNTLAVTLRTDDAGHWTQDTGRRTYDIVPPLPYTIRSQVS